MLDDAFPLAANERKPSNQSARFSSPPPTASDRSPAMRSERARPFSATSTHSALLERLYGGASLRKLAFFAGTPTMTSSRVGRKQRAADKPRAVWTSPTRGGRTSDAAAESEALQTALCRELQQLKPPET